MSAIKIPKQYYMGRRKGGLAFITPDGTDQAAEKRKATVNSWAGQREGKWVSNPNFVQQTKDERYDPAIHRSTIYIESKKDSSTYKTFDNTPQKGFKLCKVVGRWCTANKAFEIEDPRGFRIQIYSNNLVEICQQAGIKDGVLLGEYVYGREGANNVLLPIGSDIYQKAFQLTKDVNAKKYSVKDLKIGDRVTLLHYSERIECTYVGRQYYMHTTQRFPEGYHQRQRHYSYFERQKARESALPFIWEDIIDSPKHCFLYKAEILTPGKPNILTISKGITQRKALENLQIANGPQFIPHKPSQWGLEHGHHITPVIASVYSLQRRELLALKEDRKSTLDSFENAYVPGTRK